MERSFAIMEKVKKLLGEVVGKPSLPATLTGLTDIIADIGLNSVQMINFVLVLEDEFAFEINFEKLDYSIFESIDTLCEFIGNSTAKEQ